MYESFDIVAASGNYPVSIEPGGFQRALNEQDQAVFLVDAFFCDATRCLQGKARAVLSYEASESIKSLEAIPRLIETMRAAGANRQTRIVAIGGGTIQDLAAFAASIYTRGIAWIYIPTTILGMVDSCIGGKSSINVGAYKNLVGTFHPPSSVFIDPQLARTLPLEEQAGGLIEAAKICFCHGYVCFREYLAHDPRPGMDAARLATLISCSLRAKKWFIETDEFDENERLLLNFGHTFGHAIEGASHFAIAHGLAVGLGMLCALAFSRQAWGESPEAFEVELLEDHLHFLLGCASNLSGQLARLDLDAVMERFESDKKHRQDSYVLILVTASGRVKMERIEKSPRSTQCVRDALASVLCAESVHR